MTEPPRRCIAAANDDEVRVDGSEKRLVSTLPLSKSNEPTRRELSLAEVLMSHRGQVLSREQLLSHVWGYDFDPGSNVVDVYVGYLRRKLGAGLVTTVRGLGYRVD